VYNIVNISLGLGLGSGLCPYGVKRQYFGYIVAVSFSGGGNQRKPTTCRMSL